MKPSTNTLYIAIAKKSTVLNLIQRMEKIISILKNTCFSGKGRQPLHICINVMTNADFLH